MYLTTVLGKIIFFANIIIEYNVRNFIFEWKRLTFNELLSTGYLIYVESVSNILMLIKKSF